jgi:hypothetical protein
MHRTLKETPVRQYDDQTHQHLKKHFHAFRMTYNLAKWLNTLRGLTPMNISVNAGKKHQNALPSTRTITPCD